jgi:hypothetical protein
LFLLRLRILLEIWMELRGILIENGVVGGGGIIVVGVRNLIF